MLARVKLKEINGSPYKRWSMWFNSMPREEPYRGLTYFVHSFLETKIFLEIQVVHGRRQLVLWNLWLSPITSATLVICSRLGNTMCWLITDQTASVNWRKVGMKSDSVPLISRATHVLQWSKQRDMPNCEIINSSEAQKFDLSSDCRLQFACMKLESLVIAGQPYCGEYVPGLCIHRPSHSGSWLGPKSLYNAEGRVSDFNEVVTR